MTKNLSLLIIILLATVNIKMHAQIIQVDSPPGYNYVYIGQEIAKGTEGSPFLDDWQHANINFKNGKTIADLMVRYNVQTNQMLYQENDETYVIGAPDSISEIKFLNKTFIYAEYAQGNKTEKSFFEILLNDKVSLFNKYVIKVIPSNYNVALDSGNKNDKLSLQEQLYLYKENQIAQIDKKSNLLKFLSDKKEEVSDYINKENLSCKDKEDIIKIITFYNQLQ